MLCFIKIPEKVQVVRGLQLSVNGCPEKKRKVL